MNNSKQDTSSLSLSVQARPSMRRSSKKLPRQGFIPAIVYGPKTKSLSLSLKENTAIKYSSTSFDNKIFTLVSEDKNLNGLKVIKKDISYHHITRKPIHMDFLALDMSQTVKVTVEIQFNGKAKGVKEAGGVLNLVTRSIEVECLPNEIPSHFEIDISNLDLNESYHVSDLQIPQNIKLVTKPTETICLVTEAQEEVVQETPVADAAATTEGAKDASSTDTQQGEAKESKASESDEKAKK